MEKRASQEVSLLPVSDLVKRRQGSTLLTKDHLQLVEKERLDNHQAQEEEEENKAFQPSQSTWRAGSG